MVVRGFDISTLNPFNSQSNSFDFLSYSGGFSNYLISGQELLVTGNFLMFLYVISVSSIRSCKIAAIIVSKSILKSDK